MRDDVLVIRSYISTNEVSGVGRHKDEGEDESGRIPKKGPRKTDGQSCPSFTNGLVPC